MKEIVKVNSVFNHHHRVEIYPFDGRGLTKIILYLPRYKKEKYHLSKDGSPIQNGHYLDNDLHDFFRANTVSGKTVKQIGRLKDAKDYNLKTALVENLIETDITPREWFHNFILDKGFENPDEVIIIVNKFREKMKGIKKDIEFNLLLDNHYDIKSRHNVKKILTVYVTDLKETTTDVEYMVEIPDDLYYQSMKLPDTKERPLNKIIKSFLISDLRKSISDLSGSVYNMLNDEISFKKANKKIVIHFSGSETVTRDELNFAYAGNLVNINFKFFICYEAIGSFGHKHYFGFDNVEGNWGGRSGTIKSVATKHFEGQTFAYTVAQSIKGENRFLIDWSEEREEFLDKLHENFVSLKNNLNNFLSDLDNTKIDNLINNSNINKLLGK